MNHRANWTVRNISIGWTTSGIISVAQRFDWWIYTDVRELSSVNITIDIGSKCYSGCCFGTFSVDGNCRHCSLWLGGLLVPVSQPSYWRIFPLGGLCDGILLLFPPHWRMLVSIGIGLLLSADFICQYIFPRCHVFL